MQKTWKPTTGGILSIFAGALGVIGGIAIAAAGTIAGGLLAEPGLPYLGELIAGLVAVPIVLGIVAIIGDIYALRRRVWGPALAGGICALSTPPFGIVGLLAIIFVTIGKEAEHHNWNPMVLLGTDDLIYRLLRHSKSPNQ
jgi:hypothetical protein